jgi:hypothetical protein
MYDATVRLALAGDVGRGRIQASAAMFKGKRSIT